MSDFVREVGELLASCWNAPEFQFRLEHFVKTKRDRELLSHFHGWTQANGWLQQNPDATLEDWFLALQEEPKFKDKSKDLMEGALKDALIQVGCEYPDMDKHSSIELQNANRLFAYLVDAAGKMLEAKSKSSASSATVSPAPVLSSRDALSISFKRKLDELEGERDRLAALTNSVGDLSEKLGSKQTDLKVAKQECARLESQVRSALNEIKGNLTTDLEDVEKAHNKMSEYKKLIGQRDEASNMVGGLEREISALKRAIEEQKKESRKDIVAKQQALSQDIDILVKAAEILGVSLEVKPVEARQTAKPRKANGTPRRGSATPPMPSRSSSSHFVLSEDQRRRINALPDGVWYGTKKGFGHAGVVRAASTDPDFKTNADFLQAMIDRTYNKKTAKIPGSTERGLPKCIPAVRNKIASFPIWDGAFPAWDETWEKAAELVPDALETFIQSREQQALQQQAS